MPLWVTAPEQEHVIRRPPFFVSCMANEFKFLYIPDAPCRTCNIINFTQHSNFQYKKLKMSKSNIVHIVIKYHNNYQFCNVDNIASSYIIEIKNKYNQQQSNSSLGSPSDKVYKNITISLQL